MTVPSFVGETVGFIMNDAFTGLLCRFFHEGIHFINLGAAITF
jgi:hypothetical protein